MQESETKLASFTELETTELPIMVVVIVHFNIAHPLLYVRVEQMVQAQVSIGFVGLRRLLRL